MIINPIIPIWLMTIICVLFFVLIIKTKNRAVLFRRILIIILLFAINIRVMKKTDNAVSANINLDVLFVIDNTISMIAEDYNGTNTRLSGVRNDCKYIMKELAGASFSIITFDNYAKLMIPYTSDIEIVGDALDNISVPYKVYGTGTTLNIAKDITEESLKKRSENAKIIFFISDGEITVDSGKLESFSGLRKYITNGAVLGYGTTTGGYMKVKDYASKDGENYLTERYSSGDKAKSKIDESNLKKIASDMGVDYIRMDKQNNINSKIKEIKNEKINEQLDEHKEGYEDTYYYLLFPMIVLLIMEYISYKRRI